MQKIGFTSYNFLRTFQTGERKTEEMRNERNAEFAPPNVYAETGGGGRYQKNKRKKEGDDDGDDAVAKGLRNLKNLFTF